MTSKATQQETPACITDDDVRAYQRDGVVVRRKPFGDWLETRRGGVGGSQYMSFRTPIRDLGSPDVGPFDAPEFPIVRRAA